MFLCGYWCACPTPALRRCLPGADRWPSASATPSDEAPGPLLSEQTKAKTCCENAISPVANQKYSSSCHLSLSGDIWKGAFLAWFCDDRRSRKWPPEQTAMLSAQERMLTQKDTLFKLRKFSLPSGERVDEQRMLFLHVHTDTTVSVVCFAISEGRRLCETSFQQVRNAASFCCSADPTLHSRHSSSLPLTCCGISPGAFSLLDPSFGGQPKWIYGPKHSSFITT